MITVENLWKFYGDRLIFKDTKFELGRGELCFVVGPNGCGKSTLLRIIAGLSRASKGRVEVEVGRTEIGYIGHFAYLYRGLTALENLEFWNRLYKKGIKRDHLLEFLSLTGLASFAHERVGCFSRGMVQRLNLARLMLLDPKLYLLDEPSSGLDASSREILYSFIREKKEEGKTILWVSHDSVEWENKGESFLRFRGSKFVQERTISRTNKS